MLSRRQAESGLLSDGWSLVLTEPHACARPSDVPSHLEAFPAMVPGTVAAALEMAGHFDRNDPEPLIDKDAWYRRSLANEAAGPAVLRFEGLATIAEVFLDDRLILPSESMFESHDVPVELDGTQALSICFRALRPRLERTGPRSRWRPRLINNQGLRLVRTTTLGFMPGWCPNVQAVGPWRPISLARRETRHVTDLSISARLADDVGVLAVSFAYEGAHQHLRLACNGQETAFQLVDGRHSAELLVSGIRPWWPHTHGEPALYDVGLRLGADNVILARIGFRDVAVDRGADGNDFALIVNGEKIFCRGSVWTTPDIVGLPGDRASYEPWLRLAKEAGVNMIRIPGIATYESPTFFALCDELGLMVWQDLMFANFDYPVADPDFMIHVKSEVGQFLKRTQANPSLAIVCGGSEIWQQGAMLGLPERIWKVPLYEEILASSVRELRPDLPYVANSPSGGALPFYPNAGVAHYYGVGAYQRPLEDARHANVRFAAECLAFSNLSDQETLACGKAGIPRDAGADWDFEDVRDYYLGELYGIDPQALRQSDFERYLALSRVVTGEVMEATFAEWRRRGSSCNGALTFTFQDVMPGPGWGVIAVDGRPKPAWFALKRAFRPVQVLLADEGTNGLDVHLMNETGADIPAVLEVACLRDGRIPVVSSRRELTLSARSSHSLASTDLFGAFFDTNHAYRFGPPSHNVTIARLANPQTRETIAEAFHFPCGRAKAMHDAKLIATMTDECGVFWLEIRSDVFAQSVTIEAEGYHPSDNGFHLAPGAAKRIRLRSATPTAGPPVGCVRSLGGDRVIRF